jgi:hypothetical protein
MVRELIVRVWELHILNATDYILEFIDNRAMFGECEYFCSRIRDPSDGPQKTKWQFTEKWLFNFCS